MEKNKDQIPIFLYCTSGKLKISKQELIVPKKICLIHITATIRKQIKVSPEQSLFFYANKHLLNNQDIMEKIYE